MSCRWRSAGEAPPHCSMPPPLQAGQWPVPLALLSAEPLPNGVLRLRYAVLGT
jgi:hypothetical protein